MTAAFVFPGQGSQSVGMMADLAQHGDIVRATFAEASDILGLDLLEVVIHGPRERLDRTEITQPAMLTAGIATWRVWQDSQGQVPAVMAGHSLGEWTALVCAGALSLADSVGLVRQRARAMQEAVPAGEGAMAAVLGLDDAGVEEVCRENSDGVHIVEPVNYNAPGQVVIAGHADAVDRAIASARARGARRAVLLPVSVPSHSSLMKPAAEALAPQVGAVSLAMPEITVISSVEAKQYTDIGSIRNNLVAQVHRPVRWTDTIGSIVAAGCTHIVECGPGGVLTGLNRRITKGKQVTMHALTDSAALKKTRDALGAT